MSNTANASETVGTSQPTPEPIPEPREITTDEFEKLLEEQNQHDIKKWADLEIGKIYTITAYRTVNTSIGVGVILTLLNYGEVWCPLHLVYKINGNTPPFYVRPLGLKPCKGNSKNKYHAYDLVVPNVVEHMHEDYVRL